MKGHFGVESHSKSTHAVVVTPTNKADGRMVGDRLYGEEMRVWGDRSYHGLRDALAAAAPASENRNHYKGYRRRPLSEEQEATNCHNSSVQPNVEHPIGTVKRVLDSSKVRYRGIENDADCLFVASAIANWFLVR